MKNALTISTGSFANDVDEIEKCLSQTRADKKELNRTRLILEESFFRIKKGLGGSDDFQVTVVIRKRFDAISLQFIAYGAGFNPLIPPSSEEDEDDTYRYTVLNAYARCIGYQYKNNRNLLTIAVLSPPADASQALRNSHPLR